MWLHLYPFHFLQPKDDGGQNYTPSLLIKQNYLLYLVYAKNLEQKFKQITTGWKNL